jgi:hypothetical protein
MKSHLSEVSDPCKDAGTQAAAGKEDVLRTVGRCKIADRNYCVLSEVVLRRFFAAAIQIAYLVGLHNETVAHQLESVDCLSVHVRPIDAWINAKLH